jgi:SWIM/SEC-C metal-binding protein
MSKLFFKGRIDKREKYQRFGYNTNRQVKLGTKESPLSLVVGSEQRKEEIDLVVQKNSLFANFEINSDKPENLLELDTILHKPVTHTVLKKPSRNALCACGSGNKFKKCCAQ